MRHDPLETLTFTTARLDVGEWRRVASDRGLDLVEVVGRLLDPETTRELPDGWRGEYSPVRVRAWIAERNAESPTLLVIERTSGDAVGLVMLYADPGDDRSSRDVRIGYLLDQRVWGNGFATEVVSGLVEWARDTPSIGSLTGGVSRENPASARVLIKAGFVEIESRPEGAFATYRQLTGPRREESRRGA